MEAVCAMSVVIRLHNHPSAPVPMSESARPTIPDHSAAAVRHLTPQSESRRVWVSKLGARSGGWVKSPKFCAKSLFCGASVVMFAGCAVSCVTIHDWQRMVVEWTLPLPSGSGRGVFPSRTPAAGSGLAPSTQAATAPCRLVVEPCWRIAHRGQADTVRCQSECSSAIDATCAPV